MYAHFASFYDEWQDPLWYDRRISFLMKQANLSPQDAVYEGGCGAGHMTRALASAGLSVTATDTSVPMLRIAAKRLQDTQTRLFREDLRALPVRTGFRAFLFCLDVIQYLAPDELLRLFRVVWQSLPPGGVLVFDHLTEKLLRLRAADPPVRYASDGKRMLWKTRIAGTQVRYELHLWENGEYLKEIQNLRVYKKREIRKLLLQSGDWQVHGFSDYTFRPMRAGSERYAWFAKKLET